MTLTWALDPFALPNFNGFRVAIDDRACIHHKFRINDRLTELMPDGWGEDLQAWCDQRFGTEDRIYLLENQREIVMSSANATRLRSYGNLR